MQVPSNGGTFLFLYSQFKFEDELTVNGLG